MEKDHREQVRERADAEAPVLPLSSRPVSSVVRARVSRTVVQAAGRDSGNLRRYIQVDTGFHRCDKPKLKKGEYTHEENSFCL
jgi:hypothetical protein